MKGNQLVPPSGKVIRSDSSSMVTRNDQEYVTLRRDLPQYADNYRATKVLLGKLLSGSMTVRNLHTCAVKAVVVMLTPFCLLEMSNFAAARGRSVDDAKASRLLSLITVSSPKVEDHEIQASSCIDKKTQTSIPPPWGELFTATTATAFVIALMTYTSSVYSYHRVTEGDKHQRVAVLAAFATGSTIAWTLGLSLVVGIFSLGASGAFLGLLVSDIFHSIALRHRQQNRRSVGERPGMAVCDEKIPFLGDEASPEFVTFTRPLRTAEPCAC